MVIVLDTDQNTVDSGWWWLKIDRSIMAIGNSRRPKKQWWTAWPCGEAKQFQPRLHMSDFGTTLLMTQCIPFPSTEIANLMQTSQHSQFSAIWKSWFVMSCHRTSRGPRKVCFKWCLYYLRPLIIDMLVFPAQLSVFFKVFVYYLRGIDAANSEAKLLVVAIEPLEPVYTFARKSPENIFFRNPILFNQRVGSLLDYGWIPTYCWPFFCSFQGLVLHDVHNALANICDIWLTGPKVNATDCWLSCHATGTQRCQLRSQRREENRSWSGSWSPKNCRAKTPARRISPQERLLPTALWQNSPGTGKSPFFFGNCAATV